MGDVSLKMSGDEQDLIRAMGRAEAKISKLEDKLRSTGRTAQRTSRQAKGAMAGLGKSISKVAGLLGAAGLAGAFAAGLGRLRQDADSAVESLRRVEGARRAFGQIADTPQQLRYLKLKSQELALEEGIAEAVASRIVFQAQSGGILGSVNQLTRAAVGLQIDPAALMSAVVTMQAAGGEAAGTPMDVANRLLAAAKRTKLDVTQLAGVAALPGAAGREIGASQSEILSLVSALTGPLTSPEMAGQRVKVVAEEIRRAGFGGAGIMGGLEAFRGEAPELFEKRIAGRAEFAEAVALIKNAGPAIAEAMREISAAPYGVTPIQRGLKAVASDPQLRKMRELRREEVAAEMDRRELIGEESIDIATAKKKYETAQRRYRESLDEWKQPIAEFLGVTERIAMRIAEGVVGPDYMAPKVAERARELGEAAGGEPGETTGERLLRDIRDQMNDINTKTPGPRLETPVDAVGNDAASYMQ